MIDFSHIMSSIGGLKPSPTLAVAVSGGPDSMALLMFTHDWAKKHGGKAVALTVDHGLRKASAAEARQVNKWCEALGVEHHILKAPALKKGGIQDAARQARYCLLTDWCKAHGIKHLFTAHHRGDQAETLFFRLARGSGLMGLAAIAPLSEMNGVRLVRPLLSVSKAVLKKYLRSAGQDYIEDPSNESMAYTRNVIRAHIASLENADAVEARAAALAEAFGRIRARLETLLAQAEKNTLRLESNQALMNETAFRALPPETARLLLGKTIQRLSRAEHPPRGKQLERLYQTLLSAKTRRTTLGGMMFTRRAKAREILISAEPGHALKSRRQRPI